MYIKWNINPYGNRVGDCVIRAIGTVTGMSWDDVYDDLCLEGKRIKDMPSSNAVWGSYLKNNDFYRYAIPNTCPECYTVRDFCDDHPTGKYVLCTGTHAIAAINGNHYDTWDSGDEIVSYYWKERTV